LAHDPTTADRAIDTIAKILTSPFEGSYLVWDLINRIKKESPASLTPLTRTLVDKLARADNSVVRVNAIMALGEIGPEAKPAAPSLLDASKSGDLNIATSAVAALAKIDPTSAATRLSALLDWMKTRRDSTVRLTAMASLRDIGPAAASAIPELLHVADEDDLRMSSAAIEAISKIDPATGSALKQAIETRALRSTSRDDP
jgi:HEAT repeat protein